MHFNMYLDDALGRRLDAFVAAHGVTRSAVIRHAVGAWLDAIQHVRQEVLQRDASLQKRAHRAGATDEDPRQKS